MCMSHARPSLKALSSLYAIDTVAQDEARRREIEELQREKQQLSQEFASKQAEAAKKQEEMAAKQKEVVAKEAKMEELAECSDVLVAAMSEFGDLLASTAKGEYVDTQQEKNESVLEAVVDFSGAMEAVASLEGACCTSSSSSR